ILTSDLVEKNIEHLMVKQNEKHLVLAVHPYLHAFFTKGLVSQRLKWYFKYKRWVNVIVDTSLAITEYKFLNKEGEEIQLTN
ncbi:MAG TPA: ribonuclease E/G, partial [Chryseosolibacter sp.]|nr:ribonuclease E/G [Chryseosolibacter sp.]